MPAKKSNPTKSSTPKKKATDRQNANERIARGRAAPQDASIPRSSKQLNQGRFRGETALTGEDRPATKAGGKQDGYRGPALNRGKVKRDTTDWHKAPAVKRRPMRDPGGSPAERA